MTLSKFYVNIEPPQSKKVLWIKPLEDGFALYIWFKDKWQLLKVLDDNGTPIIWDDITLDFYTKEEVDNKLADILGLDAEGIAELKALIEDGDALTGLLSEIAKIPKSIEDLSDGERVDNIEKALSESLALYDFSNNQQHAQSPNLLFNNPESLIGELNLYWNWPSEVGSQTYYVAWNSGANGNYIYAKKGTITMKIVTFTYGSSSNPDLLIRWGTDTQYHMGSQWPYGEETVYTSSDHQEADTWIVRNITFEVPNDGYLFCFGNVFSSPGNMFPVLYINLSSEQLVEVSKKLAILEDTLEEGLSEKVDKELGKGLSTNDYTNVDKGKVDTLPQTYESKLTFITSNKSSVSAVSNTYCRFTSNPYSSITVTLPTSPNVGDVCVFNFITNSSFSDITWYNGTVKTMKDYTVEKGSRNEVTALYDGSGYWLITNVSFTI